ncbi:glycogen synthase GlgA [Oscillospiraceae bacterium OttesenSCG-928-G22]|nr:glycogen synthase GlgA [Oscillospiraceae bacterium OttesenSCG-928-G22]
MKTLFVTSEAAPFVKTGGLADVAGALPPALHRKRAYPRVMLPLYASIAPEWREKMTFLFSVTVPLSWRNQYCGVFELKHGGVTCYFLDNEYYFGRREIYGSFDDAERFAFLSRAVFEVLPKLGYIPDLIHANDWQTALVPLYLAELREQHSAFRDIKTVFTVHNIEYQGRYSPALLGDIFGLSDRWLRDGTLVYQNDICLVKGALLASDYVTTVSPTYAGELRYAYFAKGLEGVISLISGKFKGILNGIDTEYYNPETDPALPARYTEKSLHRKKSNKTAFQRDFGLREDAETPLIAIISRLVPHKGISLVTATFREILATGAQFVVLGSGDFSYEQFFTRMRDEHPGQVAAHIGFSADLASKLYAAADFLLMPSQTEPCGLSQMIAMRYGTLPIVRETGGLLDTVVPVDLETGEGNGFRFTNYNAHEMLYAVEAAVGLYRNDPNLYRRFQRNAMGEDFSFDKSAGEYRALYAELTGKR